MKIFLLTHEREVKRASNTGHLAIAPCGNIVERILWERTKPNKQLLILAEQKNLALMYPCETSKSIDSVDIHNIVIIDSTWQEAKKIYNKTPYLQLIPHINLSKSSASQYSLRRNQPSGGLCTAECIIDILTNKGEFALASKIKTVFNEFNHNKHG